MSPSRFVTLVSGCSSSKPALSDHALHSILCRVYKYFFKVSNAMPFSTYVYTTHDKGCRAKACLKKSNTELFGAVSGFGALNSGFK